MEDDGNTVEVELDELMEDIEIEDELHEEEKLRKKNAKVLMITIVGLLTIAGVYFGINYFNVRNNEEQPFKQSESSQTIQLDKETLPLQEDLIKIEKKDDNKTLPQKKGIEKNEPTVLEEIKKEKKKEKIPPTKKINTIKKIDLAKKQIKEKAPESLSLLPNDLKKSSVEKKSKSATPLPQKAANELVFETSKSGKYYIQFGQFVIKKNADDLIRALKDKGFSPSNTSVKEAVDMYRVYAGNFSELKIAKNVIIDLENEGINVTLKPVTDNFYTLQAGSFYLEKNAEKLRDVMLELGLTSRIVKVPLTLDVKKVFIGFFKTSEDAAVYQQKLAVQGFSKTLILDS